MCRMRGRKAQITKRNMIYQLNYAFQQFYTLLRDICSLYFNVGYLKHTHASCVLCPEFCQRAQCDTFGSQPTQRVLLHQSRSSKVFHRSKRALNKRDCVVITLPEGICCMSRFTRCICWMSRFH